MNFRIVLILTVFIVFSGCDNSKSKKSVINSQEVIVPKGLYDIDVEKSSVKWIGRTPVKSHDGLINVLNGSFTVNDKGSLNGKVIIDMNSINCTDLSGGGKSNLEGHLKNDDFFSVNTYPTSTINLSSKLKLIDGMITFNGDLIIKDISKPISFKSELEKTKEGKYQAKSSFSFDRSLYDIKYKSTSFFDDLGDKFINDNIEIEINIITL